MERLQPIPVDLSVEEVKDKFRAVDQEEVQRLLEIAKSLISAKAVYKVCYIEEKYEYAVTIEGISLSSQVLRKNLDKVGRVFAYVVTIGKKLEERSDACADFLQKFHLDVIGNMALVKARKYLEDHLRSQFALTGISYMSPGSLEDWPIEEQKPLFSILNSSEVEAFIGVRLTEKLLMIPRKSISGIYFPAEVTFYSCQLCPRKHCEGRKADYNEELVKEYGISK